MAERQVEMVDILNVLNWGEVTWGRLNGDDAEMVHRVTGTDIEGFPLTVTIKIIDDLNLLCITVF